jgi:hypothetical protein
MTSETFAYSLDLNNSPHISLTCACKDARQKDTGTTFLRKYKEKNNGAGFHSIAKSRAPTCNAFIADRSVYSEWIATSEIAILLRTDYHSLHRPQAHIRTKIGGWRSAVYQRAIFQLFMTVMT